MSSANWRVEPRSGLPKENGGDSRNVLAHLDQWVFSRHPDLVHVNCGLHDLKRAFGAALRSSLGRIRGATCARYCKGCNANWTGPSSGPLPRQWTRIGTHQNKGFDRLEADVEAYNASAHAVAEDLGVPIDDLFDVVQREGKARLLTQDGVAFYRRRDRSYWDVWWLNAFGGICRTANHGSDRSAIGTDAAGAGRSKSPQPEDLGVLGRRIDTTVSEGARPGALVARRQDLSFAFLATARLRSARSCGFIRTLG